jgi:dTDP-4-dehydrorhamnose reductase
LGADVSFDLLNKKELFTALSTIQPDVIVNLVGLTSVELCQEKPNVAYQINTKTVENLVDWIDSRRPSCFLIQISTDHVYDSPGLNVESSVSLSNNYAFSKYGGELAAQRVRSAILRTNFVGFSRSIRRESLTDWVYHSLKKNLQIEVLDDVFFNPLSMITLSKVIQFIVKRQPVGAFNVGSRNGMSKADFDFLFSESMGLPSHLMRRIGVNQASFLKTYRPKDMRTDVSKFEDIYGQDLPSLAYELEIIVKEYRN